MDELSSLEWILRLILAAFFAGAVGFDREARHKSAGLRTHMLVGIGAAVFALISLSFPASDPSRIAAQVVVGVGFLGAGVIFRQASGVRGLTTAAGLWVTASIGVLTASGLLLEALMATLLAMLVLSGLRIIERRSDLLGKTPRKVTVTAPDAEALAEVLERVGHIEGTLRLDTSPRPRLEIELKDREARALLEAVARVPKVEVVEEARDQED